MAHTFEIAWHGEDTDTMRARVTSREALDILRCLIGADPNLMISSVTEFDQYGVAIPKTHAPRPMRALAIDIPALVAEITAAREAQTCASGVGPFLCSLFPQCGHSAALGSAEAHHPRTHTALAA